MSYTAKRGYTDKQTASTYDDRRFRSWRGRTVDYLEKKCMLGGVTLLVGNHGGHLVLDAPAGTGRFSYELIKHGFRVVAIDISIEMMRKGEDNNRLLGEPNFLGYVCADLEHLPFRDASLDVVGALRIMGHLPPDIKQKVLSEFLRVSRLGVVIMFALDNLRLRVKRWVLYFTGLKPRPLMWFPLRHQQIIDLSFENELDVVAFRDMVRWISESRLYVFRSRGKEC